MREHKPDATCCAGAPSVRLQSGLFNRMRCRPYYFADEYARAFAAHEGLTLPVVHRFTGPTGLPYAYCVRFPDGTARDCPALYCDEVAT